MEMNYSTNNIPLDKDANIATSIPSTQEIFLQNRNSEAFASEILDFFKKCLRYNSLISPYDVLPVSIATILHTSFNDSSLLLCVSFSSPYFFPPKIII